MVGFSLINIWIYFSTYLKIEYTGTYKMEINLNKLLISFSSWINVFWTVYFVTCATISYLNVISASISANMPIHINIEVNSTVGKRWSKCTGLLYFNQKTLKLSIFRFNLFMKILFRKVDDLLLHEKIINVWISQYQKREITIRVKLRKIGSNFNIVNNYLKMLNSIFPIF